MMPRLAELFERAGDGELDAAEDAELLRLLAEAEGRAAVIGQRRIALLMAACSEERSAAMVGGLARTASASQRPSRIHLRIHARSARRRWFGIEWSVGRALAAAATLLLTILGGSVWWSQPRDLPRIAEGTVRTGDGAVLAAGQAVRADALLRNDGSTDVRLEWRDGTRIDLSGTGTLRVADGKQLRLEHGTIRCVVAPQPASRPLRVGTPHSEMEVVGTAFTVAVDDRVTRLAVSSGTVLFNELARHAFAKVTVGGFAAAGNATLPPALARGINLLLADVKGDTWQPDERNLRRLDAIASAGFSFVRVVIPTQRPITTSDGLDRATLAALDPLLDAIATRRLAIMVSPYVLEDTDPVSARLDQQRVWAALASHLASRPSDQCFFELCNDPRLSADEWNAQVALLADLIRRSAPANALVIDAHMGLHESVEGLASVAPLAATNILYAVRFFEPLLFTHQGADWLGEPYGQVARVPYPSDPQAVVAALARTPAAREFLARYGVERWDGVRIDGLMSTAAAWSERTRTPVLVANFGAMDSASKDARTTWLNDVRSACEHHRLGWALWHDGSAFSLWTGPRQDAFDPAAMQALGLHATGR